MIAWAMAATLTVGVVPAARAVHLYRGTGGGCTEAAGPLTATSTTDEPDARVRMLHNSFNDAETGLPVTRIATGETVEWQWWSAHCHSVLRSGNRGFDSGFHYPQEPPESPAVAPGVVDYPVPDDTHTLSYRRTFDVPGTYTYICIHHSTIGMQGVVIVE